MLFPDTDLGARAVTDSLCDIVSVMPAATLARSGLLREQQPSCEVAAVIVEASCGAAWLGMAAPVDDEGGPTGDGLTTVHAGIPIPQVAQRRLLGVSHAHEPHCLEANPSLLSLHPGFIALWLWAAQETASCTVEWMATVGHRPVAATPFLALCEDSGRWHLGRMGDRVPLQALGSDSWTFGPDGPRTQPAWQPLSDENEPDQELRLCFDELSNQLANYAEDHTRQPVAAERSRCWRCRVITMVGRSEP